MPWESIRELGIELTDDMIDLLAYKCTFMGAWTIGAFKLLGEEDIKNIYQMAR